MIFRWSFQHLVAGLTPLLACTSIVIRPTPAPRHPLPAGPAAAPGVILVVGVSIDSRFTPEERAAVHQALDAWNVALAAYERFDITNEEAANPVPNSIAPLVVVDETEESAEDEGADDNEIGWTMYGDHSVHLCVERILEHQISVTKVARHEIGHFLGLPHRNPAIPQTIMSIPVRLQSECITARDLADLAQIRGWNPAQLRSECVTSEAGHSSRNERTR